MGKFLTRAEQRIRRSGAMMAAVNLEAHLRNLVREILAGDTAKLVEFQQFIRYAPDAMRARIDALLLY
jgi:hypothetical protein